MPEKKKKMGRSPKWGPEVKDGILEMIEEGNTQRCAFTAYGVPEQTFYSWMEKSEFSEQVKKAEGKSQASLVKIIKTTAKRNWFAAAWLLERKWPNEYGLQHRLVGDPGQPIPIKIIPPNEGVSVTIGPH